MATVDLDTALVTLCMVDPAALVVARQVLPYVAPPSRRVLEVLTAASGDPIAASERLRLANDTEALSVMEAASSEVVPLELDPEAIVAEIRARHLYLRLCSAANTILRGRASSGSYRTALGRALELIAPVLRERDEGLTVQRAIDAARRFLERNGDDVLIPSGIDPLDEACKGWRRGGLHLVVGLSGTGKTSLLAQAAVRAAQAGYRVYVVSAEMSADDLVPRLLGEELPELADASGVPLSAGRLSVRDPKALEAAAPAVEALSDALGRIFLDAAEWPRLEDVTSRVLAVHAAEPVDLVLVDYLQLVTDSARSREEEVRAAAAELKKLGRRLGAAVVVAAQLLDPTGPRDDGEKRPVPAIRESRAAGHAADLIVEIEMGGDVGSLRKRAVLRIRKYRHGAVAGSGEFDMIFDRRSCRFLPGGSGQC